MRVSNGELLLEELNETGKMVTLTKMPFQKILALFVIGHITVTTALIEKCKKFNVALVVMKPNLRPVFYWADSAEGNFLIRRKQHQMNKDDISLAKVIIKNKICNQRQLLFITRKTDDMTQDAKKICDACLDAIAETEDYNTLMGIEGRASKAFFAAYFQDYKWKSRRPRAKTDELNVTLDIGYTILFNFIESYLRMFGFDIYVGIFHRLWFKRKSLVCDIMEPFRCIIDRTVRNAYNRKQFSFADFKVDKGEYMLRREKNAEYYKVFFDALIVYKTSIFKYVQSYYRCFMQQKPTEQYPFFNPA